jgi:flagellar export protein FliJ
MTSKRLGRLVRLKKLVEQSRAAELAEEQATLGQAEDALAQTRAEAAAADVALVRSDATADELAMASAWQNQLGKKAKKQSEAVAEAEVRVADHTEGVQLAWRERRLLEGVHERAVDREIADDESKERKRNDDIALRTYGRKGGEA